MTYGSILMTNFHHILKKGVTYEINNRLANTD